MTQYTILNLKLSNSQLHKLKSGIQNGTKVTLKLPSNDVDDSNDENNFLHKLLLINKQVSMLLQMVHQLQLSKSQVYKIGQSGEVLGTFLEPLLKIGYSLVKNVLKPLAKSVLIPLRLTPAASATDAAIYKEMFRSDTMTLIHSNEEMNEIMKIIKSLEKSGLLIKSVSMIENVAKEQKGGFLGMLLRTLSARLLGNLLTGKGTIRASEGTIKAGHKFYHPLTNFEMQKHCQNQPKFNGVYSRNNLPKINDETFVINSDKYKSIGSHWMIYGIAENLTFFDSF